MQGVEALVPKRQATSWLITGVGFHIVMDTHVLDHVQFLSESAIADVTLVLLHAQMDLLHVSALAVESREDFIAYMTCLLIRGTSIT